jgi:hypothetical protein
VHDAGGNHHTMMRKPHVLALGTRLRAILDTRHGALAVPEN